MAAITKGQNQRGVLSCGNHAVTLPPGSPEPPWSAQAEKDKKDEVDGCCPPFIDDHVLVDPECLSRIGCHVPRLLGCKQKNHDYRCRKKA